MTELKSGFSYLFKTTYGTIIKGKVIEVTKTCYKIKWDKTGHENYENKSDFHFHLDLPLIPKYLIIEELS